MKPVKSEKERDDYIAFLERSARTCNHCHAPFAPAKPWARFCSEACRIRAFRAAKRASDPSHALQGALAAALTALRTSGDVPAALAAVRREIDDYTATKVRPSKRAGRDLRARFAAAVEQGHTQAALALAIGFADGSALSRWRKGKPIPPEREAALAAQLDRLGVR